MARSYLVHEITKMGQEHTDYIGNDLPPPYQPYRFEVVLLVLAAIALVVLIAFGLFMRYLMQFAH